MPASLRSTLLPASGVPPVAAAIRLPPLAGLIGHSPLSPTAFRLRCCALTTGIYNIACTYLMMKSRDLHFAHLMDFYHTASLSTSMAFFNNIILAIPLIRPSSTKYGQNFGR